MSNVVFTTELVERIGLLGDVMASFLEEQVEAIQKRLSDKYPDADEGAAWSTISKFTTLEGTKIPMTKEEVLNQVEIPEKHLDLMLGLFDKARILRLADGIYEIAHDTLALQVSERRSGEEKALLEVKKVLTDRYAAYVQTGALLTNKEVGFISPYQERLDMSEEQEDFYKKSRKNIARRRAILIGALIAVFSIISLFAVYALIQQRLAIQEKKKAEIARVEAEEQREIAIQKEKEAIENAKEAERQRKVAVVAQAEALRQKDSALVAQREALRQKVIADEQREKAEVKEKEAIASAKLAELKRVEADTAKAKAERAQAKAVIEKKKAEAAEKEAIAQREKAMILRKRALATAIAIKSADMKYQDEVKGKLAMEAYSLQLSTGDELAPPDIYTGLYAAVNRFKGDGFDEIEEQHQGAIRALVSDGKNSVLTVGSDGNISSWTFSNWSKVGKPKYTKKNIHSQRVVDLVADKSPNSQWMAIGGKKTTVDIINTESNVKKVATLHKGKHVYDIAFSGDSKKIYSVGGDNTLQMYNMENGASKELLSFLRQTEHIALDPSGKYIAIGNNAGQLQIYDLDKMSTPVMNANVALKITAMKFDATTKSLIVGRRDGRLYMFQLQSGQYSSSNPLTRKNHDQQISDIKFNKIVDKNNNVISEMAVASYDGSISLWSMNDFGDELYEPLKFANNQKWATSVDFINDGKQLVAGYADGKVKFWTLSTQDLADELCELIKSKGYSTGVELDDKQYIQYFGEDIKKGEDYQVYCK